MIRKYYDQDCNLSLLDGKTVAVLGFGSQGHAHAMNLKESGVDVVVGLRSGSAHEKKAKDAGLKVTGIEEAAEAGDIVMMLTPDELQSKIYKEQVEKHLKPGNALAFAHGFNIVEQWVFFIASQDSSLRFVESQLAHEAGFGLEAEGLRFVGLGGAEHGRVYRDVNGDLRFEAGDGFSAQDQCRARVPGAPPCGPVC